MRDTVLKMIFDAPLQSYGVRSKWDYRDTSYFPSKSAVIGVIASAMGIERDNPIITELGKNLEVSVRIEKRGSVLNELQTVNSIPVYEQGLGKAKLKVKKDYHPLLTKMYLQDAIFTVYVKGEKNIIEKCYEALQNPIWPYYLGRKCCVPSSPVVQDKLFYNVEDIVDFIKSTPIYSIDRIIKKDKTIYYFEYIVEDKQGNVVLYDTPSHKGQKFYTPRAVIKGILKKELVEDGGKFVFK